MMKVKKTSLVAKCRGRGRARSLLLRSALSALTFAFCLPAFAFSQSGPGHNLPPPPRPSADGKPALLREVGIEQRLDEQVPLELEFRDESGQAVRLGDYFGSKPVILSLVYYGCPMLCNQVLTGLTSSLDMLTFDVGKEFDVVTVSFDARETPEIAREKKPGYMHRYKRKGAAEGWHFLTGTQQSIDRLTEAVGFGYAYDPQTNQFAHASGIMLLTPQGKLARYFYGIEYAPKDLRLGLIEASQNKIGTPVDQVLLYCFHYDPTTGKYGPVVMNMIRLGGIVTLAAILAMFIIFRRRNLQAERVGMGGTA